MKSAGSVLGLNHTEAPIELIRAANVGRIRYNIVREKIAINSSTAQAVLVKDVSTGKTEALTYIIRAANYTVLHHSYVAKCLVNNGIY